MDVTKIKAGDYFSIDGVKYEFAKSATSTLVNSDATRIVLTGVDDGFTYRDTTNVVDAIASTLTTSIGANSSATYKYNVTTDGTKITLTAPDDDTSTTNVDESTRKANVVGGFNARTVTVSEATTETTTESTGNSLTLQIGDTADSYNQMKVDIKSIKTADIKLTVQGDDGTEKQISLADIDISTQEGAVEAMGVIKNAINYVSDIRGTLGATQNRLEHTINNLSVMQENIQDAESTIRDTNIAEQMMQFTRDNIKLQASQAMLAQANQMPQSVLGLIGG